MVLLGNAEISHVSASLSPALRSNWRYLHILCALTSYASFVLSFAAAIGYLVQEAMLKAKRFTLIQHLPSLDDADRLAYRMVAFGFLLLTCGIVTGSIWAQSAWGSYWSWDRKEIWSLFTWLVYAVYLHVRILQRWHGKWATRLLIFGFCCIIMTYLGVTYWGGSLHRY